MRKVAGMFAIGAPLLALALWAGSVSAGTVNIDCYCDPAATTEGYCICENSQGISPWATNEYDRRCKASGASVDFPDDLEIPGPMSQVRNIPSGVTCTEAQSDPKSGWSSGQMYPNYIWQDCTNWNLTTKHVTVLTYCLDTN